MKFKLINEMPHVLMQVSTKFDMRQDMGVLRNYGRMLVELSKVVPDGIVCFFVSYQFMDSIITKWNNLGLLRELTQHKLVFIETQVTLDTSNTLSWLN